MKRSYFLEHIDFQYKVHPVCGLLGPRQVGKTTLAQQYSKRYSSAHFFDLENPFDLARLENPMLTLSGLESDLIVIDEIQRRPELFPILRVLVDKNLAAQRKQRFLILGSASRDLLQQSSETLAGRIGYLELPPFSFTETKEDRKLWLRGGFPRSYLAESDPESQLWRQSYITTFLERDLSSLGFNTPPLHMRRLWMMLAHHHGQILNASEIGKSLGITHHTVRKYLEILAGTFMVRILPPWFENISKRQVKSPKIYMRDSGLYHTLMGIQDWEQLQVYPKLGSSWEGFALEETIKCIHADAEECYFWGTQAGAELDLLVLKNGKKIGFEFKYTDVPKRTASMHVAIKTLRLDHLYVIFPHHETFPLAEKITALGLNSLSLLHLQV
jgi:predicted AAA+ superfamily ATPase